MVSQASRGESLSFQVPVRDELLEKGFSYIPGREVRVDPSLADDRNRLMAAFRELPIDPYASERNRQRRHGRFVLLPWREKLIPRPAVPYVQGSRHNPDDGDLPRQLPELEPEQMGNRFLREMILEDFRHLPLDEVERALPYDVGVHMVRTIARPGVPGTASPNCLHKDGEPYTYVHMVGRDRAEGGSSQVADNDRQVVFEATLEQPLDTLVVRDEDVYHAVLPLTEAAGAAWGCRDVLLIDFTPFKPALV